MKVLTGGVTLADAMRQAAEDYPQAVGSWGDGKSSGCFLTTAFSGLEKLGYVPAK